MDAPGGHYADRTRSMDTHLCESLEESDLQRDREHREAARAGQGEGRECLMGAESQCEKRKKFWR